MYAIMKTMYPPGYHHNGFVASHALGHMIYGCGDKRQGYDIYICILCIIQFNYVWKALHDLMNLIAWMDTYYLQNIYDDDFSTRNHVFHYYFTFKIQHSSFIQNIFHKAHLLENRQDMKISSIGIQVFKVQNVNFTYFQVFVLSKKGLKKN